MDGAFYCAKNWKFTQMDSLLCESVRNCTVDVLPMSANHFKQAEKEKIMIMSSITAEF
jgi:hypothetical protein